MISYLVVIKLYSRLIFIFQLFFCLIIRYKKYSLLIFNLVTLIHILNQGQIISIICPFLFSRFVLRSCQTYNWLLLSFAYTTLKNLLNPIHSSSLKMCSGRMTVLEKLLRTQRRKIQIRLSGAWRIGHLDLTKM